MGKKTSTPVKDLLDQLAAIAEEVKIPMDCFHGDLQDSADEEADLIYKRIKECSIREQLEFLYLHGFGLGRLREMIQEASAEKE